MPIRRYKNRDRSISQGAIAKLAHVLWCARGRPFGSPDTDWLLVEQLIQESDNSGPFDRFIRKAEKALRSTPVVRGKPNDREYVRVVEERRYILDILDRTEMLDVAFLRLRVLARLYLATNNLIDAVMPFVQEAPSRFNVPDELVFRRDSLIVEASVIVSFVYYELTTLVHMLRNYDVLIPDGELTYLTKARDKFIAHPYPLGRSRSARGSVCITPKGLLHPYAINANESDPAFINFYCKPFLGTAAPNHLLQDGGLYLGSPNFVKASRRSRMENEKLILSKSGMNELNNGNGTK